MGSNRVKVSVHSPASKRFDQSDAPTSMASRYSISGSSGSTRLPPPGQLSHRLTLPRICAMPVNPGL